MLWIIGGQGVLLAFAAIWADPVPEWLEYQLEHVSWEGFAAYDLIMPLFLFISGASLPFPRHQQRPHGPPGGAHGPVRGVCGRVHGLAHRVADPVAPVPQEDVFPRVTRAVDSEETKGEG